MDLSILKTFKVFGVLSGWVEKALDDGKITVSETVDLAEDIASIIGIPLHIDISSDKLKNDDPTALNAELTKPRQHKPGA